MNYFKLSTFFALTAGLMLTSCFDDSYDLSNIDKTVRINVNDLVVPVNIDTVKLSSIFDLKEGDRVKIINGQYAIVEEGSFNSDVIEIPAITLGKPEIAPTETEIYLQTTTYRDGNVLGKYPLVSDPTSFNYHAEEVSEFITRIDSINGRIKIAIKISFSGIENVVKSYTLSGMTIQLPKGLNVISENGEKYDKATGTLRIPDRHVTGNSLEFSVNANSIDFKAAGGKYTETNHSVDITGEMKVVDGFMSLSESDIKSNASLTDIPSMILMRNEYNMDPIDVYEFSGAIRYDVEGVNVNDIELNDLPDLLSQDGTMISLVNPQIYLQVTNPLENYSLYAQTDFTIITHPRNGVPFESKIDDPYFKIPNTSATGTYNFCLSPSVPSTYYPGYESPIHVKYTSLSNVLYADGLPTRLEVKLSPEVPNQNVVNFALGRSLGAVDGKYTFFAPLELGKNSIIAYRDTVDGWSNEDLQRMTVTALEINLAITSDIPVSAVLEGYPIDVNGNQINNVTIEGANIDANAKDQQVKLHITGEVKNLDGIIFKAKIVAADPKVLTPDMHIYVKNVRPRVSGYYEKEL